MGFHSVPRCLFVGLVRLKRVLMVYTAFLSHTTNARCRMRDAGCVSRTTDTADSAWCPAPAPPPEPPEPSEPESSRHRLHGWSERSRYCAHSMPVPATRASHGSTAFGQATRYAPYRSATCGGVVGTSIVVGAGPRPSSSCCCQCIGPAQPCGPKRSTHAASSRWSLAAAAGAPSPSPSESVAMAYALCTCQTVVETSPALSKPNLYQ